MRIAPPILSDIPQLVEIAFETFGPFYEGYVRSHLGDDIFLHQHGNWQQDYRDDIPTLHQPGEGRNLAVAKIKDVPVGFVAWKTGTKPFHGEIHLLAESPRSRRQNIGRELCDHAIKAMRSAGAEVVEIGTGGDEFHAPARALYENLGFTKIPVAVYFKKI